MYQGGILTLAAAVLMALQLQTCVGTEGDNDDTNIIKFIYKRIPQLQGQATSTPGTLHQFGAIILLTESEVRDPNQFSFDYSIKRIVNNKFPFRPRQPTNYIAARPDTKFNVTKHAEEIMLEELADMWGNFTRKHQQRKPAMIVLFTRLFPCNTDTGHARECAQNIMNRLTEEPYNSVESRLVVYNSDDEPRVNDPANQAIQFVQNGIMMHGLPMNVCFRDPYTCPVPSELQTLQGCVLQCLEEKPRQMDSMLACVEDSQKDLQKAYLINILINKCLQTEDRRKCFSHTFRKETGRACMAVNKNRKYIIETLQGCHEECKLKPISTPRQHTNFDNPVALMTNPEERKKYNPPNTFECSGWETGLLCTKPNQSLMTAGNTRCRDDHQCGYHGESYKWCYTSDDNSWEYCCSGPCGYHGHDFLWCNSGSTWQKCGEGGAVTTGSRLNATRHCLANHPCGLHGNDYFWCYVNDNKNWDYCCSPTCLQNSRQR